MFDWQLYAEASAKQSEALVERISAFLFFGRIQRIYCSESLRVFHYGSEIVCLHTATLRESMLNKVVVDVVVVLGSKPVTSEDVWPSS